MTNPTKADMRRWFPKGFVNRTPDSAYHIEFGDRVVCYLGTPMFTMPDARSAFKLIHHLRDRERKVREKASKPSDETVTVMASVNSGKTALLDTFKEHQLHSPMKTEYKIALSSLILVSGALVILTTSKDIVSSLLGLSLVITETIGLTFYSMGWRK